MFFELRQYRALPGKRDELARYMEDVIIPFQITKGMVITASFVGEQDDDLYVWIRRFRDEAEREALYAAVYQSDEWKNTIGPKIGEMLDREKIAVSRLTAMPKSVMQ